MSFSQRLTDEEIQRYSRHILLPEVGGRGQVRLKESSVLVVGAGGLGSPVALYLAAAGVGRIGLIDSDVVDRSNLQRQVLHDTQQLGRPKVESGAERLKQLNPNVTVETYHDRLGAENVADLISRYDVIVGGVDNFPARYLLNDACVMAKKPLVEAGILKYDGMVMTIKPYEGPCYRCIFPEPPPPGTVPTCSEAGVLGALAGVMGSLQAFEVLKVLLDIGEPLIGRMLMFEGLRGQFRTVEWDRNPKCPVCGDHPTITTLSEYRLECDIHGKERYRR
ncbi:MAG TPA: molybdopterin-synthase adenylyltransferase MoeB [Symbiobacteriaceae bacterium]|nr:molybdopterin-synthase adenylyltransferase MoeB [Symbiobacteriaceae bacterium]